MNNSELLRAHAEREEEGAFLKVVTGWMHLVRSAALPFLIACTALTLDKLNLTADVLDHWVLRSPRNGTINAATHGNGLYVLVGELGTILTSPDLDHWTPHNVRVEASLVGVAWGNGKFVALGRRGEVFTSPDGATWADHSVPYILSGIVYANGLFVAVSDTDRLILTSPDGITWTPHDPGTEAPLYAVTYGNDQFVATGGWASESLILSSGDGFQWTRRGTNVDQLIENSQVHAGLFNVVFADGQFAALGGYDSTTRSVYVLISKDGVAWELRQGALGGNGFNRIASGMGLLVGVGPGVIASSPDGIAWTVRSSSTERVAYRGVWQVGGHFIATGEDASLLFVSDNGLGWREVSLRSPNPGQLVGVTYARETFVAVGENGLVETSPNGVDWTVRTNFHGTWVEGVAFGNGTFVAVGFIQNQKLPALALTSEDGVQWQAHTREINGAFHSLAFGNGTFVAVGESSTPAQALVMISTNGVQWEARPLPAETPWLWNITFGGGKFVAVGNTILSSLDGVNWERAENATGLGPVRSVIYAEGLYVAAGNRIITSPDAVHWTVQQRLGFENEIEGLAYGNGWWVGVSGAWRTLFTSTDGLFWTRKPVTIPARGVAFAQDRLVAVGGSIQQSEVIPLRPKFLLRGIQRAADGKLRFGIQASAGTNLVLESSADLRTWAQVQNLPEAEAVVQPINSSAAAEFYRLREK